MIASCITMMHDVMIASCITCMMSESHIIHENQTRTTCTATDSPGRDQSTLRDQDSASARQKSYKTTQNMSKHHQIRRITKSKPPRSMKFLCHKYWNKKWKPNPAIDNNMQIEQIHMTPHAASVDPRSSNRKCQLALQQGYNCFMENKWPTSRLDRAAEIKMINLQE